jgi:hypothetical protein
MVLIEEKNRSEKASSSSDTVSKRLRGELDKIGNRHEESYEDIIAKCVKAYRKYEKNENKTR